MLMPGKLTVDPIASFPLALSLRRFPIRRLVSSHLINAFFSFLRPHRKAWEVSTKHTATRATFAIPPPSSPSVLPFLSHPNPSIARSSCLDLADPQKDTVPTPQRFFSQPASLVPSKPTRVP
ncbi:hypothetical protein CEP51_002251 [Fusarium floridanum]|uniref:Uncharacterized protein n=1 Tax=Fusarium floridanum TaxID=1325733 RepID=A0A428SCF7_9HYPO|nr:hypothetical protein CEP51_002251 [Fusarium floridanum]